MHDPYEILGLPKNSSDDDIKKAYRTLAKKYHPDLNPNNKEAVKKFKEISVAYKMIENKEARDKFEKGVYNDENTDTASRKGPFYSDFQDSKGRYAYHFEGNAEDLFESLFSGFKGHGEGMDLSGQDHQYTMEIGLKDAINGLEQEIILAEGKRLKVKIPAGIKDKTKLRFKNLGGQAIGKGKPGDAYVEILIRPSDVFTINENNLEYELPVSLDEAVNGTKIKVPTMDGTVMLTIPPGINTGSRLRIKEKGMTSEDGVRGDQIVIIKIVLPGKIDTEFKEFISKWTRNNPYNPRENMEI
jgi:DnaJ-class molecular chaperone